MTDYIARKVQWCLGFAFVCFTAAGLMGATHHPKPHVPACTTDYECMGATALTD